MMMPANYSAIAENEMTYVVGGGLLEAIGSVTAPVWGAANVKTFNTNLLTKPLRHGLRRATSPEKGEAWWRAGIV